MRDKLIFMTTLEDPVFCYICEKEVKGYAYYDPKHRKYIHYECLDKNPEKDMPLAH